MPAYAKRDLLADLSRFSGVTRVLSALPRKPLLIVLNYHRIGEPDKSPYDAEVFSATPQDLDTQISFWKRRFHIATLEEAIDMVERPERHRGTSVLFTFDDGYLDNYELAFPLLANHGVQAIFFLPTSFIGTNRIPWWDVIAYIVKNSRKKRFRLEAPPCEFDLAAEGIHRAIPRLLDLYRRAAQTGSEHFIALLEEACDSPRPNGSHRCFLNWDEAAAMLRGGMSIGSHTHSHEILSRLPDHEQLRELETSRSILQERLGSPIDALSYPVGLRESFSSYTQTAAQKAGYRIAFSFYGGLNKPGSIKRYDVMRYSTAFGRSIGRYQLQAALAAITGSYWF
jgi:peptidoglycan/xylan/chitin deacetylase (PgdA/CDA1 family)